MPSSHQDNSLSPEAARKLELSHQQQSADVSTSNNNHQDEDNNDNNPFSSSAPGADDPDVDNNTNNNHNERYHQQQKQDDNDNQDQQQSTWNQGGGGRNPTFLSQDQLRDHNGNNNNSNKNSKQNHKYDDYDRDDDDENEDYDDDDDDRASLASSAPSTLYARCRATFASSVHSAVMIRRLKKTIDSDVTFLHNRLTKLKHEEERSRQEVAQLRKKKNEMAHTANRQYDTAAKRKALQDQVDFAKRKEAALIALNKEKQAKAVWASKEKIIQKKQAAVSALKEQKKIDQCQIQIIREEQKEKNAKVREAIRQLHVAARETRERLAEEQREQSRLLYAQRLEQEQRECAEKEKLASELVAQEAELVYRLKRMHDEKQKVLGDLLRNSSANVSGSSPTMAGSPAVARRHERANTPGVGGGSQNRSRGGASSAGRSTPGY